MRRRNLLLGLGALALLGVMGLLLTPHFVTPTHAVTLANFHRLREGMTRQEVEAILGQPLSTVRGVTPHWEGEEADGRFFIELTIDAQHVLVEGIAVTAHGAEWVKGELSFLDRFCRMVKR
jgi:hypothetical protein